ncbi:MAG: amidohydrolase [Pirellulales bacterium]
MKSIFHVQSSVTLALVWMFAGLLVNAQAPQAQPDLAVIHADIRTMDDKSPQAEAIAMKEGRIIAIGSSTSIRQVCGPQTRVIDAGGKLVVPGFNDAHVHFTAGGRQLSSVQLRDAQSPEEFTRRLKAFAEKLPQGNWITGGDWDHENFPGAPLPNRRWIDDVTSDHPVFITRLDGHMGLANSAALRAAGIDKSTPDPDGGLIVRELKTGDATGILKDAAMNLVTAKISSPSHGQRSAAALAATNHAASLGVTSVQDMSGAEDVLIYRELLKRGDLKTRIYAAAPLPRWQRSADQGLKAAVGDMWIREGALKGFADGSLGSMTAYFFEPYTDDPRTPGLPSDEMFPAGAMQARIEQADRAGLQIMIHAIGDRANDQILSLFESTAERNGSRDRRFRIEHAQHLRMQDIARFSKSEVIASMQPYHCADDGRWAEKRIGPERVRGTYAFRSLLDSRARLAFGSDWNVAPLDPIQGIAAAVTRRTLDGAHPDGWVPEQKITVEEAVRAYTLGSAYAEFTEQDKGSLAVGKLVDLVILSDNLFTIPVGDILKLA